METEESIALSKLLYEQLCRLRNTSLGPALALRYEDRFAFEEWRNSYKALFADVDLTVQDGIINVSSPWHAALLLFNIQQDCLANGRPQIFRGQANSTWPIAASIDRKNGVDRVIERKKSKLFADILATVSFNALEEYAFNSDSKYGQPNRQPSLRVAPTVYYAAAQHYDIATDLIDWTTDIDVAVFFAADRAKSLPNNPTHSSVFVLDVHTALNNGFSILTPPPFVERIHLQRGFFLRNNTFETYKYNSALRGNFLEVRFPYHYSEIPFDVIRGDEGVVNLLPSYEALDELKIVVQESVGEYNQLVNDYENYKRFCFRSNIRVRAAMKEMYQTITNFWDNYAYKFEQSILWSSYNEFASLKLNEEIFRRLILDNGDTSLSIIKLWNYYLNSKSVTFNPRYEERIRMFVTVAKQYLDLGKEFQTKLLFMEDLRKDFSKVVNRPLGVMAGIAPSLGELYHDNSIESIIGFLNTLPKNQSIIVVRNKSNYIVYDETVPPEMTVNTIHWGSAGNAEHALKTNHSL